MSRDQVNSPALPDDALPSERSLAIQVVILTLGMIGYVVTVYYLFLIEFFPDMSVMS